MAVLSARVARGLDHPRLTRRSEEDMDKDDLEGATRFVKRWLRAYEKMVGSDACKSKLGLSAVTLEPTRSIDYRRALALLRARFGGARFEATEFHAMLVELGYAFSDDKGNAKGSGRDYLFVLQTFCDGNMKTSAASKHELDVSDLNLPFSDLGTTRRRVCSFESTSGNSGHGRMQHALKFVMLAQLRMVASAL